MSRIAFVSTLDGDAWGGSEELWSRTAAALAARGHEVFVNTIWRAEPARQIQDLAVKGCRMATRRTHGISARVRLKLTPKADFAWLARCNPEMVVVNQGNQLCGLSWMNACRERGMRYAVLSQAATEHLWPDDAVAESLLSAYRSAEAAFFVSRANIDLVRAQVADPLENAKVVRNPFNVAYDAAPEWPEMGDTWRLATVGRLEPAAKGQDLLLKVLASKKWRGRPIQVTIYGSGANQETLRRLAQMYELTQVEFGGFVQDVQNIWTRHHGLILPSRYEGLPLAVVETMLCNRFCIVTDVAGNAELIDDNETGFVASAAKAEAIDEAMERAWDKRMLWREIGAAAGRSIRRSIDFDPVQRFVEELEALVA